MKIKAAITQRNTSVELGKNYGESWTREECDVADLIDVAYEEKRTSLPDIIAFLHKERNIVLDSSLVQQVIDKIELTNERLLKEDPPCLSEEKYNALLQHKKPRKW